MRGPLGRKAFARCVLATLSTVAGLAVFPSTSQAQQKENAGHVSKSVPPAFVQQPAAKKGAAPATVAATSGVQVRWQDVLETKTGGRLRTLLNDGSVLSLGSDAKLTVVQHDSRSQQSDLVLAAGRLRAQVVRLANPDSRFEVRTSTAVCGVLGTDEIVDASNPTATVVIAISGVVTVRSSDPTISGSVQLTEIGRASCRERV